MKKLFLILSLLINFSFAEARNWAYLLDNNNNFLIVELAKTPKEQQQGLMYKPYILPFYGMLFVFEYPQPLTFWMKNTLSNLDIRFYDSNLNLINNHFATPCFEEPCKIYPSKKIAKFVLEVNPKISNNLGTFIFYYEK